MFHNHDRDMQPLSAGGVQNAVKSLVDEQINSPNDSKIMIKELQKRVEAVNLWDK